MCCVSSGDPVSQPVGARCDAIMSVVTEKKQKGLVYSRIFKGLFCLSGHSIYFMAIILNRTLLHSVSQSTSGDQSILNYICG